MHARSFFPVPERPTDYADYFQREFYRRMNEKAAQLEQLESGVPVAGPLPGAGPLAGGPLGG